MDIRIDHYPQRSILPRLENHSYQRFPHLDSKGKSPNNIKNLFMISPHPALKATGPENWDKIMVRLLKEESP